MRFFKKIQNWFLTLERIRKWILRFFTKQINPGFFGSWGVKGTEESTSRVDSLVPLHLDQRYLGLICLVKKRKIHFRILSDLRIQSWFFLKKRTLRLTEFEGCTVTYGPSSFPNDLWPKHKPCRPYSMDQEHKVSKIFIISLLCI